MISSYLIPISLTLGWMLSPDVLVRLGNGVGEGRTLFLAALGISAMLAGLSASLLRHPDLRVEGRCDATALLVRGIGRVPTMTLTLTSRITLVLLLPTGLLVTAGFTFNEVFVYWFPNFGFSFLLLAIIVMLHLLGEKAALAAQPVFIGIMMCCMALLCLAGLGATGTSPISVDTGFTFSLPLTVGCLLLFLGYDYTTPGDSADSRIPALAALIFCLLIFAFWSMLSMQYVSVDKLADSTIPHMLTAREILGQPGRVLMGIGVISGVCGAVNGLFLLAGSALSGLADHDLLPGHRFRPFNRRLYISLLALIIGLLMMAGLAGQEILEVYIQAALILWLVHISAHCFAVGRVLHQLENPQAILGFGLSLVFIVSSLYLVLTHDRAGDIVRFNTLIVALTALFSAAWLRKTLKGELL